MEREIVQQLRVAGPLANAAEILQRLDDPGSKKLLPITIHGHASCKRLTGLEKPLRQRQPVARNPVRQPGKDRRNIRREVGTDLVEEVAAFEFKRRPLVVRLLFHHHWQWDAGNRSELFVKALQTGDALSSLRILRLR